MTTKAARKPALVFAADMTHSPANMLKTFVFALGAVFSVAPLAAQTANVEIANLRQDVALLVQRVGDLSIRVETLERENAALRKQAASTGANAATVAQLNDAVSDLNKAIRAATADSQRETLQKVAAQMEALARQTNSAIQSVAKNAPARVSTPTFTDDYPKEGATYTVARGDTLSSIAQKHGVSSRDIINANKITDPTKIQVGQTLFIPGAK